MCHEGTSGHLGVLITKNTLVGHFFWRNCYKDIEQLANTCDPCQRVGKTTDKKKAPLMVVPVISEEFSKINIGACGPLHTSTQVTIPPLSQRYVDIKLDNPTINALSSSKPLLIEKEKNSLSTSFLVSRSVSHLSKSSTVEVH
ncbi:hypothetical protein AVEN_232981-1 [Araneus ventricosus]|uniref:Integrase zinc-binding domain-containing protein n=1 Tax=Araneus ventricosus TaxID=182803 RepID=A0A4Y2PW06_ARAVE|nr:hypothetical protein AVEN_232981-1 [Araneus ventricosus]